MNFQSDIFGGVELKDLAVKKLVTGLMETKPATYNSHRTLGLELYKKIVPGWDRLSAEQRGAILVGWKISPDCKRRAQEKRAEERGGI